MKCHEVIVYVEGPSDKRSMETLLKPLLEMKEQQGIAVKFVETPPGDRKKSLLTKVPLKAAIIIRNNPRSHVVAMPDLYPKNKGFPHETFPELENGIQTRFQNALKRLPNPDQMSNRFRVFCFKHDLEALLLAAQDALQARLGIAQMAVTWRIPVEDQDHNCPPKRIVESLYQSRRKKYVETIEAPSILAECKYEQIAERCPQCFKPFVEFLTNIRAG